MENVEALILKINSSFQNIDTENIKSPNHVSHPSLKHHIKPSLRKAYLGQNFHITTIHNMFDSLKIRQIEDKLYKMFAGY